jgi:hypothetical protein
MAIFGQYQGGMGQDFNVGGNMDAVLKQQQATHQSMLDAVSKFNQTREEMSVLQQQTGAILSEYGVDEKGKPDDTAPKYVHDLFKNVNKEGGIANLSRTQLVAGLKAYETGTQVESQRQNQAFNAQKLRQATLTNDITEMQMQAALKAEKEAQRIREAYNNPEIKDAVSKIATEGVKDVKEVTKEIKIKGETVRFTKEEIAPILQRLNDARLNENKEAEQNALDEIGRMLHGKTSKGRESNTNILDQYDENGMLITEEVKNPDYVPYQTSRDVAKFTERKVGQDISPTIPDALLRGIANKELEKLKASTVGTTSNTEKQRLLDKVASTPIGAVEVSTLIVNDKLLGKNRNPYLPKTTLVWKNPKTQKIQEEIDSIDKEIAEVKRDLDPEIQGRRVSNVTSSLEHWKNAKPSLTLSQKNIQQAITKWQSEKDTLEESLVSLERQRKQKQVEIDRSENAVLSAATNASKAVAPYTGGEVQASADTWKPVIETVQKKYKRTLDEQTEDEYNILRNHLEATGGIPATFTKEAFYASKGIQRPMVVQAGGGYVYAQGLDGKGHFLEDKTGQSSQMSVTDQEKMWKAGEFSKARNLNNLTVNGYTFKGEVRVGDIDQANKVKDGVFKTTRALSAMDSLLDIAENKSMFDKLLPTEVSGIAQALANTVQAANRTEVGGSGAWSNQDQANIDKIIRDPSKAHNAIFSSQTVASLKAYRARLEQSMVDSGSIYGFAFERNSGSGSMSSQVGQFRIQYAAGMAKFGDPAQALEYAKQSLNFNANE